jgi:hypothetical protein
LFTPQIHSFILAAMYDIIGYFTTFTAAAVPLVPCHLGSNFFRLR